MTPCPWFFASHGCDLPAGHDGDHECKHDVEDGGSGESFFWAPGTEGEFT